MADAFQLFGLDIETTGSTPGEHQLIQIGVVSRDAPVSRFVSDVGGHERLVLVPQAMAVNKFTPERIARAPSYQQVDRDLAAYFAGLRVGFHKAVPMGFNVGSFDIQFVRRLFPQASYFISFMAIDLNSILLTLADLMEVDRERLKTQAVDYAKNRIGHDNRHDAGYDALEAIYAYEWCRDQIRNGLGGL